MPTGTTPTGGTPRAAAASTCSPRVILVVLAALAAGCGDPTADATQEQSTPVRSTAATLTVAPNPVPGGQPLHLSGCGYAAGYAIYGEDAGPAGVVGWSAVADAAGCLALDRAAGHDAGSHTLKAYQKTKRGQRTLMAQASLTVTAAPLSLVSERYFFRWDPTSTCVSEDDTLDWSAMGSLAPGQSFSFTPRYPDCVNARAVMVKLTAAADAELRLSTVVPAGDGLSNDMSQAGTPIVATPTGGVARLCMFPNTSFMPPTGYTITVTNVGATTAQNVTVTGKDRNDWIYFYWNECLGADADHDGWSDSLEHAMAQLVYPTGNFSSGARPAGSAYLRVCGTPAAHDEFDTWPPDLDDDGVVTQADVDLLTGHLGEGNGIPWATITPNPGVAASFWNHTGGWNRFDLNADGWVDARDLDIVRLLVGTRCGP